MKTTLSSTLLHNFSKAIAYEWLETNGLGGWAGSSVVGAHTRRYHGLLVAALNPPLERKVLLSRLDETLMLPDGRFELASNRYPGVVHPGGHNYLVQFEKEVFPVSVYQVGKIVLKRTIAAVYQENTTLIQYELLEGPASIQMELQPFYAFRDYHQLGKENDQLNEQTAVDGDRIMVNLYPGFTELFLCCPGGKWQQNSVWYHNFEYSVEHYRGLDYHEDLFSNGHFSVKLKKGKKLTVIASTRDPKSRDGNVLLEKELDRRIRLLHKLPQRNQDLNALCLAADQFIVQRGEGKTIIAGYPWFADWGRDTMIALPGLTLCCGRKDEARQILLAYKDFISEGMLPNRFPDDSTEPEYNTVDAVLWYVNAIYKYWQFTRDPDVKDLFLPAIQQILEHHISGTRYAIRMDNDGLLSAGADGVQLTWMDARVGEWVVTPRSGKAVEINALWYNALSIAALLYREAGDSELAEKWQKQANSTKRSFNKMFWYDSGEYLYDFINGEDKNKDIRPNQILAISLPFAALQKNRWKKVLSIVEEHLLTPVGLRSLSPVHPAYRAVYGGDAATRDSMYHQGTVWGWLMGPFISALVRVRGKRGRKLGTELHTGMMKELRHAGVGSISEIFDAVEPFTPRGAIAQAWSVGELIRVQVEDLVD